MLHTPQRAIRAASLVACAAAMMTVAQAADPPKKAPATKGKPLLLSREELRVCMSSQATLHQHREEAERLQAELSAEKEALARAGEGLKEQLTALDRTNQPAVEQYVEANNAREKRIDAYEVRAAAYNTKVEALGAEKEAYAKNCENKRIDEADELTIRKGK